MVRKKNAYAKWLEENIEFSAAPPESNQTDVKVVRAQPGVKFVGFCLSNQLLEVNTHWINNRSLPCFAPNLSCCWCDQKRRRRWYGYMPCQVVTTGRLCVFQVTVGLVRAIPSLRDGSPILHKRLTVERVRGTGPEDKRGRLIGKLEPNPYSGVVFHPEPNTKEILANMWAPELSELGILPDHIADED
jgi:hypothetical protein